jgi:hypothetical protein
MIAASAASVPAVTLVAKNSEARRIELKPRTKDDPFQGGPDRHGLRIERIQAGLKTRLYLLVVAAGL